MIGRRARTAAGVPRGHGSGKDCSAAPNPFTRLGPLTRTLCSGLDGWVRKAFVAAFASCACSAEPTLLELPTHEGDATAIIASATPAGIVAARVFDLATEEPFLSVPEGSDQSILYALYEDSPADLQLERGELRAASEAETFRRTLPTSNDAYLVDLGAGQRSFAEIDGRSLPAPFSTFEFSDSSADRGCLRMEARSGNFDVHAHATFGLDLGDFVLIGTEERNSGDQNLVGGKLLKATVSERSVVAAEWGRPAGLPISAAFVRGDELWFAGNRGELWSAGWTPAGLTNAHQVSTSSTGREIRWMAGAPANEPFEIFTLSAEAGSPAAFERFDGERWELLFEFPEGVAEARDQGTLARVGPGRAIVAASLDERVVWYESGEVRVEVPRDGLGFGYVTWVEGFGVVLGGTLGVFLRYDDSSKSWVSLGDSGIDLLVLSVAPWAGGFVYGGINGFFGHFRKEGGFCDQRFLPSGVHTLRFLVPMGPQILGFGDVPRTTMVLPYSLFSPI
ncbi:MAG: hypothetical protein HY791_25795 [Deltaproteobacteria bacterium]|nr:hypothetical protein [Deltaproteobacteria bacterium]